jgi:hypothetical protein
VAAFVALAALHYDLVYLGVFAAGIGVVLMIQLLTSSLRCGVQHYPTVQHYDSKSAEGTTKVKLCFISLKKLYPNEEAWIRRLLAQEKTRERRSRNSHA